ncbi:restriction endonuclease subunit S [uncultured Capnocytophaga sp.]|uniref:restriction endonuclease subunit S n=1 Tax=uncultured Capnocytophaga sp. TaxID=159273 RepID=UPI00341F2CF6
MDEEIPFEIPNGWEWARISNIFQINPKNICSDELEVAFIPMEKLSAGYGSNYSYEKVKWRKIKKSFAHFANGDIAFAKITPCFQNRKSAVFEKLPNGVGAGTTELKILRTFTETINRYYLLYFLKSPYFVEEAIFKGTANQQRIISGYLENKLFPLPPLEEQQRIVEKIEELIPHIEYYSKAQTELDVLNKNIKEQLKKSVLQYAIEGKLVPQDEAEGTAEELLLQIQKEKQKLYEENKLKKKDLEHSTIFKGEDNKYYEKIGKNVTEIESDYSFPNSWAITRLSSVCILTDGEKKEGQNICLGAKFLRGKTEGDYLQKGRLVEKGDNIILVDGENSGEVFTIPRNGYMGSTFKKLWVNPVMDLQYVLYFIQFYKDLLRNSKKGAAIPHLNKELFYSLLIGIPPLSEQQRIVNTIQNIFRCIEKN